MLYFCFRHVDDLENLYYDGFRDTTDEGNTTEDSVLVTDSTPGSSRSSVPKTDWIVLSRSTNELIKNAFSAECWDGKITKCRKCLLCGKQLVPSNKGVTKLRCHQKHCEVLQSGHTTRGEIVWPSK